MKSSMSTLMRGAVVAAAVALAPALALAGTVSETQAIASQKTAWGPLPLSFAGFNSFNTGGILQSVSFLVTETLTGSAVGTNSSSGPISGNFEIQNTATVTVPNLITVVNLQPSATVTNLAVGASTGILPVSGSQSNSLTLNSGLSSFLTAFSGAASDSALESLNFGGGNLSNTAFTDNGGVTVQVTYTYGVAPVPEPASFAVVGFGLIALGLVRRKSA